MKHNFRNKDELLKEAFKQREQLVKRMHELDGDDETFLDFVECVLTLNQLDKLIRGVQNVSD